MFECISIVLYRNKQLCISMRNKRREEGVNFEEAERRREEAKTKLRRQRWKKKNYRVFRDNLMRR